MSINESSSGSQFALTSGRAKGYRPESVDVFLQRIRDTYEGRASEDEVVRAFTIRQTAFPLVRKGYEPRYVDAALDRLEEVLFERERQTYIGEHGQEAWNRLVASLNDDLLGRVARERQRRFRRRSLLAHGYRRSQVDAIVDQIGTMIASGGEVRTADIRQLKFHAQRGGYCESQVDAYLDSVVEWILAQR